MSLEKLKEVWKQVEPVAVSLRPGELRRVGNWIVEKTEDGRIVIYEIEDGNSAQHLGSDEKN